MATTTQETQLSDQTTTLLVRSGLIGLGEEETARVNVANLGGPDMRPRRVQTTFYDVLGNVVKRAQVEIALGQSFSLDVGYEEVEETSRNSKAPRKPLRVELGGFNPQPDPPGVFASLEVFASNNGATRFISDLGVH
jgi:hypothetical protein